MSTKKRKVSPEEREAEMAPRLFPEQSEPDPIKELDKILFHPLALIFPELPEAQLKELAEDIKANGLREPIVYYQGQILDGRNRYKACLRAEFELMNEEGEFIDAYRKVIEPSKDFDPLKYVISANMHRRHLTDDQRAAIAADLASRGTGVKDGDQTCQSGTPGLSNGQAAKLMQVSERKVDRAKKRKKDDPEAHGATKRGDKKPKRAKAPEPEPVAKEETRPEAERAEYLSDTSSMKVDKWVETNLPKLLKIVKPNEHWAALRALADAAIYEMEKFGHK